MSSTSEKIPYWQQLKSPHWQRRRLEILERDEFKCRHCMDKETTLHVHHVYYEKGKMAWDYPNNMLVTLCDPCHERIEATNHIVAARMSWNGDYARNFLAASIASQEFDGEVPFYIRKAYASLRFLMQKMADVSSVVQDGWTPGTKAEADDFLGKVQFEMDSIKEMMGKHFDSLQLQ